MHWEPGTWEYIQLGLAVAMAGICWFYSPREGDEPEPGIDQQVFDLETKAWAELSKDKEGEKK